MKIRLLFLLSLFGVAIGTLGLFAKTSGLDIYIWLVIFVFYAYIIAKNTSEKLFLHGFLVSFINGFWIAIIHALFFDQYIEHNPNMLASFEKMPQFINFRYMMLITGPIIGALLGLISGLFAYIAEKLMKRN